ncbi:hypothetical protein CsSME_00010322 [Camellia sinensis var. sinensis]
MFELYEVENQDNIESCINTMTQYGRNGRIMYCPLMLVGCLYSRAHLNAYGDTASGMLVFCTVLFRILRITLSLIHVFNVPRMILIWIPSGVGAAAHRLSRDECVLHPDMLYETIGRMLQVLDGQSGRSTSTHTQHQVYYHKCHKMDCT